MVVAVSHTIVDEDTVVIKLWYAPLAYAAMFRSGRFQNVTSSTCLTWMKYGMIIWIQCHGLIIVPGIDIAWIGVCSEIEKDVWKYDRNCSSESESCVHHGVCWWNKHYLRDWQDQNEEYLQTISADRHSSISILPNLRREQSVERGISCMRMRYFARLLNKTEVSSHFY